MRQLVVYVMTAIATLIGISLCLLLSFISYADSSNDTQIPTVDVLIPGQGTVRGNFDETRWTNKIFMQFRGIPYAESPSGERRFKPPVPRAQWDYIMPAVDYGQRCPVITTIAELSPLELQKDLEDCLNLCVYTKNLTAKQTVMFYIYGGGYYNGSNSDHPPHYLLERDIVLVVPNYRVGALGWLTTYSEQLPGNAPIADILLALQWVQQHIHAFGGDPSKVTIFGQSAGAGIASALLFSPAAVPGTFRRAIVQSGAIFANWAINRQPQAQALRICQALNCSACGESNAALESCLLNVSVSQLLDVTKDESFSPVVGDLQGILPQHPNELAKRYKRDLPIMTGFTKHDGSFVLATYYDAMKQALGNVSSLNVRQFAQGMLNMNDDTSGLTDQLITRLLFTRSLLTSHDHKQALPAYFDLTTNVIIKSPVINLASKLVHLQQSPIYVYSFEYEGEHTRFGYEFGNAHYPFNGGVHHSNDNIYLFATHTLNEPDTEMAKCMVNLWTTFAIDGKLSVPAMRDEAGPYFRIGHAKHLQIADDLLQDLTATMDDTNNVKLDRPNIDF